MKKIFMGYDLGDGESIISFIKYDTDSKVVGEIQEVMMPSQQTKGMAIPTMFAKESNTGTVLISNDIDGASPFVVTDVSANFKKKPASLLGNLTDIRKLELLNAFNIQGTTWPSVPEAKNKNLVDLRDKIVTFTNAIFCHPTFQDKLAAVLEEAEDIEICVGHPTKWAPLDIAIYKKIIQQSVLGKGDYTIGTKTWPLSLVMDSESRSAFLYTRHAYGKMNWNADDFRLLIDVGSSTIDVTALSGRSVNGLLNSGHNFLGARIIDYLILDWYLEELAKVNQIDIYYDAVKYNATAEKLILYACRKAKEKLFSTTNPSVFISCMDFFPLPLRRTEFEKILNKPIKPIMEKYLAIPKEELASIGNRNWKEEFEAFLVEQKQILDRGNHKVAHVILTGSAARMSFIKDICEKYFGSSAVFMDMDPAQAISKGLALVGQSNNKSKDFREDIEKFLSSGLGTIIVNNLPDLADGLADLIADVIADDIIKPELTDWKEGKTRTLDDTMRNIKNKCGEENLSKRFQSNYKYKSILENWTRDKLIKGVDQQLDYFCKKYGVKLPTDKISILAPTSSITVSSGLANEVAGNILAPADMLAGLVAIVAGIVTYFVLPTVIAVILVIISHISITIAGIIFSILAVVPGAGWFVLFAIAGIAVATLIKQGWNNIKGWLSGKISAYDLPKWVRDRVKTEKLTDSVNEQKYNIKYEIKNGILSDKAKDQIVQQLKAVLSSKVEEKAKEICYIIENV